MSTIATVGGFDPRIICLTGAGEKEQVKLIKELVEKFNKEMAEIKSPHVVTLNQVYTSVRAKNANFLLVLRRGRPLSGHQDPSPLAY